MVILFHLWGMFSLRYLLPCAEAYCFLEFFVLKGDLLDDDSSNFFNYDDMIKQAITLFFFHLEKHVQSLTSLYQNFLV
jgi:hypothetical protein